jgi:hypothetical protein
MYILYLLDYITGLFIVEMFLFRFQSLSSFPALEVPRYALEEHLDYRKSGQIEAAKTLRSSVNITLYICMEYYGKRAIQM